MKTHYRIIACCCLVFLGLGIVLWLSFPRSAPNELQTITTNTNLSVNPALPAPLAAVVDPQTTTLLGAPLPPVAYPPGSIGEACEVNKFPPRVGYFDLDRETELSLENSPFDRDGKWKALKNEKCLLALERHLNPINPYLWGTEHEPQGKLSAFAFVNVDNPVTFERLFTDPVGDFALVQEVFSRPECQLGTNADPNWELHESCHADALLNYALLLRFCYGDGSHNRPRKYYEKEDNPTPEQDRSVWIQGLEAFWVRQKCKSLDPNLKLQLPLHTVLQQQIHALQVKDESKSRRQQTLIGALIDLAARLGDPTAALTQPIDHGPGDLIGIDSGNWYDEAGYKYGPFAEWFTRDFRPDDLFTKHPPSLERLYVFLELFAENLSAADGHEMKLNHDVLVQHLCSPPYVDEDTVPEPPSCREIIIELRQKPIDPAMLEWIATFEDVAMRLDVYE
ncbi:MAG: hypothetical protein F4039_09450 [Gammaproteobacteria bacterium]|nr:hypothetical protein [Gammaproteobacteria bacterium]